MKQVSKTKKNHRVGILGFMDTVEKKIVEKACVCFCLSELREQKIPALKKPTHINHFLTFKHLDSNGMVEGLSHGSCNILFLLHILF